MTLTETATPRRSRPAAITVDRLRPVLAGLAAAVAFAAMAIGVLGLQFALPLIGVCLAFAAPADPANREIRPSPRNVALALVSLSGQLIVFMLPAEAVFLLSTVGADATLAVIALAGVTALAVPLAMRESTPTPSGRTRLLTSRRNVVLASAGIIAVTSAHVTGGLAWSLLIGALVMPVPMLLRRWSQARRGQVDSGFWRAPLVPAHRAYLWQVANVWILAGLAAGTVATRAFEPVVGGLGPTGSTGIMVGYAAGLVLLAALPLVPLRGVRLATNLMVLAVSIFIAGQIAWIYSPPTRAVVVQSPLAGSWYVAHGGRSALVNGHQTAVAQDYALDLLQVVDGSSHRGAGREAADFYAWQQPVLAPADGVVATVSDDLPDQVIGSVDRSHPAGNHVVLQIGDRRYVCFGHLKSQSVQVAGGQRVQTGDVIGLVGNSGNSDEPHLHLQAQNSPVFDVLRPPVGLDTYPLLIEGLTVTRGNQITPERADLRRGDVFAPTP